MSIWRVALVCGALSTSAVTLAAETEVQVLQDNLSHPWAVAFLPDNQTLLITERSGQLRSWRPESGLSQPIQGVPEVDAERQGGLLDVVLAPDFAQSRRVWLSYTTLDTRGQAGGMVGYGQLSADNQQLTDFRVVLEQTPKLSSGANLGIRMAFDQQGFLYISFGDNFVSSSAQQLDKLSGKIIRLTQDGTIPSDNPFIRHSGARPEIWSYGVRNPQGLALNPWTQQMWESEHGPRGGDEINLLQKGHNYGWPLATYGIDYSGKPVPEAKGTQVAGTDQPLFWWKVSPAVSGMAFYNSSRFPQWKNSLFIGALKEKSLIRLSVEGTRVTEQQRLLTARGERIRDVRLGPDGWLYVLTDEARGKLLRVGLAQEATASRD